MRDGRCSVCVGGGPAIPLSTPTLDPHTPNPAHTTAPTLLPRCTPVHKLGHLLKVGLDKAAAGQRGRAHAQATRHHGADVACDRQAGGGGVQWGA